MSKSQHPGLTLLAALWIVTSALGGPATTWAERDTRLANEYLSLLVDRPEYGRVVDLLWDLYRKRDATALLLENIHTQAAASQHPSVLLVEAHLVRKSGDLKRAAALYDEVLKREPGNVLATRARSEVASELGDSATALALLQKLANALPDSDPSKVETWMQLGNLARANDRPDEASSAWEAAAKLKPQDMNLARNVAQLMLRAGHPERAASFLEALTHQSDPQKLAKIAKIDQFYLRQFGYFLDKMKAVKEGDSTLLDNSMIVFGGGIGDGNRHNHDNLPILLAGRAGGTLTPGKRMVLPGETPMTNLYLSMLDRMGVPAEKVGDSTGKLEVS